jgi:hypothetical protein
VPEEKVSQTGELPFRYIGIRIRLKDRQLHLFDKARDGYLYFAIVSNRSESIDFIVDLQRGRCGSIEGAIDCPKNDTGAGLMTSQGSRTSAPRSGAVALTRKCGANAAWLRYGVIALNLLEAMKILFPREIATAHAFSRPTTLRRRFVQVAGRI